MSRLVIMERAPRRMAGLAWGRGVGKSASRHYLKRMNKIDCGISVVLLDFGGVVAEEGFVRGLADIARAQGLDPDELFRAAVEAVFGTGYALGRADEGVFWRALRERAGLQGEDAAMRETVLGLFTVRPGMLRLVDRLRAAGLTVAMLSDQTDWLDELDRRHGVFQHFDAVFNSYHEGVCKRDRGAFDNALARLGAEAGETLFVDDARHNVDLALRLGLRAHYFTDQPALEAEIARLCPGALG